MSDRKPQLKELALALNTLSWSEVKSMAVQLGVEFCRLQQIEQQSSTISDRLLSAMDMWLNSDANASWARIVTALNDIDKNVLAKKIEQISPSQPPSNPTQQPRKRKRRNSPTLPIPPSPTPSPQPPPQPPQLSTTQPQELPGWQPTVVRETKQEKIRRIREEAFELNTQFVAVVGQAEFCFFVRESECKTFLPKFRITLKNLPISKKFEHMKFLEDKREAIQKASSVSEIFELLRKYWNYTDFALLRHLINEFGDNDTTQMMERYISSLETFEQQTTIKDYEDATGVKKQVPQGFVEAAFEVQRTKDPSEYTLYEVRLIVQSLAQQSSLEPYVPMIKKARIGSLVITIALPPPALELLQQALYKEFLDTLNIVSVTIPCWYKTTQLKMFCHKCLKVHVIVINCDTVACITFVTIHKHSLHSELIVLQDGLSLVSASRTGEEATVTSLLDSGADPHFRDIVRKNQEFGARLTAYTVC